MSIAKIEKYMNLRPICGFCKKEVIRLPSMTAPNDPDKITIFCCPECGAVLGVTKEK